MHGVTNTKGGKSSSNATEPQGEKESTYRETNKTEEDGYREKKEMGETNTNMLIGFAIVIALLYMAFKKPNLTIDEQLAEQHNIKPIPKEAKEYMRGS